MLRTFVLAIVVLTVLIPASLRGQIPASPGRIEGVVVDAESGRPLPAARVQLVEPHRVELSHVDGAFAFMNVAAGTYTLTADQFGYDQHTQQVTLAAGTTERIRVELHGQAFQMTEIVVTGSITRREGRDVLSPVSVVGGAELDRNMASTVAQTLEGEPGLAVTGIGPSTGRPVIRGLGGDRILMLEDGVRAGDMSSTSSDHAVAIDPITAEQIEVVRGPMSLLYGSSALGGVVNVVRQEIPASIPEHPRGSATLQGTSVNDGLTAGGFVNFGVGSFAVRAEASGRTSGDVATPTGDLENTDARNLGFSGGAARPTSWGHLGGSYRFYDNHYGIPGGFVGGHEAGVDIDMRRHAAKTELELHTAERTFLSTVRAVGTYTNYHHAEIERSGRIGTEFSQDVAAGEVVARHRAHGPFAQGAAGVRGQYRDITTGGSLRTPSTWDYTLAAFLVEEVGTGPLRLQAGARFDFAHYEPRDTTASIFVGGRLIPVRPRDFGSFSGSLGVLYLPSEVIRVGASVARAYRTPDFNELYSNGPHLAANSFDVGDPSLDSETGFGVDAFVRVTGARFRGELAAFRNRLDDYIFPSSRGIAETGTQGGRPRFQYTNESAVFTGAEMDLEWSPSRRVVLEATTSYVRARFTSDRAPIPIIGQTDTVFVPASRFPPLIPPLNGSAGVRYEQPRYFVGAGVRWATEQDRRGDFELPSDGYVTGRASAGVRLLQGAYLHAITLSVDNLTDAEYRDHLSRIKDIMPQPGRNISLMYRLSF